MTDTRRRMGQIPAGMHVCRELSMVAPIVSISGIGAISALGADLPETLISLETGRVNAGRVSLFPTTIKCPVFEVQQPFPTDPASAMRTLDLCKAATGEALDRAGMRRE